MKVFTVYHAKNSKFHFDVDKVYDIKDYIVVADVVTDTLDNVYSLTNSITDYWGYNNAVYDFTPDVKKRSTSIGDIIYDGEKYYFVDSMGFTEGKLKL